MINGADIVEFFVVFGGGFLIGSFFGVVIMGLMAASSNDSRWREEHESNLDEDNKG